MYSGTRTDTACRVGVPPGIRKGAGPRQVKQAQNDFRVKASQGEWAGLGEFPEELQWEALVDVLRGRVKVTSSYICQIVGDKS